MMHTRARCLACNYDHALVLHVDEYGQLFVICAGCRTCMPVGDELAELLVERLDDET